MMKLQTKIMMILKIFLLLSYSGCSGTPSNDIVLKKTVTDDSDLPVINVNGQILHGEIFGEESLPLVIILHGGPGADYRSLLTLKALTNEYRLIFFDQRGSGLSPRIESNQISFSIYKNDISQLIEKHSSNGKVILIGHSFGGQLAAAYTAENPEKISSLVLAEPGPLNQEMSEQGPVTGFNFNTFLLGFEANMNVSRVKGPDEYAEDDYVMGQIVYGANPEYWCDSEDSVSNQSWRFGSTAFKSVSASMKDEKGNFNDLTAGLELYSNQVLFIVGSCNKVIGEKFQKKQMEYFIDAELNVIESSGHQMFIEQPEESVSAVRSFLNNH